MTGSNRPGLICCDRPAPVGSQQPHVLIETVTSIVLSMVSLKFTSEQNDRGLYQVT